VQEGGQDQNTRGASSQTDVLKETLSNLLYVDGFDQIFIPNFVISFELYFLVQLAF